MMDIVERLRSGGGDDWSGMIREAADEIERLRGAVRKMAAAAGPAYTPRWVLDWLDSEDETPAAAGYREG